MTAVTQTIRGFVHEHDDIPAFHATYLVATFLAAAILSLGYFVILVLLHMCLDYVKYRDFYRFSITDTIKALLLESIADIALILISLTFAVYLSHDFMLVTVSGLLRSQLTILRAIGTMVPKIRVLEHVLAIFTDIHSYFHAVHPALHQPFNRLERYSLSAIGVCGVLLVASLAIYHGHYDQWITVVSREMHLTI